MGLALLYFSIADAYLVLKFPESDDPFSSGHRAVINDGRLFSSTAFDMTVHCVEAHVQLSSNKPVRKVDLK